MNIWSQRRLVGKNRVHTDFGTAYESCWRLWRLVGSYPAVGGMEFGGKMTG